jgi:hypothetical protein
VKTHSNRKFALRGSNFEVVLAYTAITIVMSWPLVTRLGAEIAWDLGDPVFNCWVMMWTGGQLLATLGGHFNALHEFWNGNIFHPSPLTIAYSEHLTPQMLQALPIFATTGNIVLGYNLVFLSTFVLSGFAAYLLVRDLTGQRLAAFFAGLAFAFAPYRLSQTSHLQVLSTYWMPLALFALRRYFTTRRPRALVGAGAALALQNLSCGYYLLFFSPFAAAYCLYEMAHRRLLGDVRHWIALGLTAAAVALVTWPFLSPYLDLRRSGDVGVRSYEEAVQFSADTWAFGTAPEYSRVWGERLRAFPKGEGDGFPGVAILGFAVVGLVWGFRRAAGTTSGAESKPAKPPIWRTALVVLVGGLVVIDLVALMWLIARGSIPILVEGRPWRDADPLVTALIGLLALLLVVWPAARRFVRGAPDSAFGFYAAAALVAALLALGPRMMSAGRSIGTGLFYWLFTFVPGFDGVRVPARYLMLVVLFLAVLAGLGAAALIISRRRLGVALAAIASVLLLVEAWPGPTPTNVRLVTKGLELAPRHLANARTLSPLYQLIRDEPGRVVLAEFPFGEPAYEILATYYAGFHRRPLVNGYSGFFPENYLRRLTFLERIPFDLDAATKALVSSGATHVIVHEAAFLDGRGHEISDWLVAIGAKPVLTHGTDKLFRLR